MEPAQHRTDKEYIFHELTRSVCPSCLKLIDAKIVITRDNRVKMLKRCPEHGSFEVLLSSDAGHYCDTLTYNKPGSIPFHLSTSVSKGCPHDCGICPDHEQHTCLALMEITGRCNMKCPICYADSGADSGSVSGADSGTGKDISLEQAQKMLDSYTKAEGKPEVLQISGGEPTLHPQLHEILDMYRNSGLKAFLINTNGVRISREEAFVKSLAGYGSELEIYLQFDSLSRDVGLKLRGQDVSELRIQALDNLEKHGILANLVVTLVKGINEHEIGPVINEAVKRPNVTGIVFQLITGVGRAVSFRQDMSDRLTVPDVLGRIEHQTAGMFRRDDFIPLPCPHPSCCSLTYAFVTGDKKKTVKPVTRYIDVRKYLDYFKNTICIDARDILNEALYHSVDRLWSASASLRLTEVLKDFSRCCGIKFKATGESDPLKQIPGKPLRILIKPFMDAYNYDLKRAKKCCIHVLTGDGRLVPFCNYNIFHRGG
ncbi:MAG: radical SAM protein [Firmicutes bacterium HGW-Firmicutes-14]|nr:MAG: radical SAM protein [Firmicutes bacterium HGW-Firmicutes-14]